MTKNGPKQYDIIFAQPLKIKIVDAGVHSQVSMWPKLTCGLSMTIQVSPGPLQNSPDLPRVSQVLFPGLPKVYHWSPKGIFRSTKINPRYPQGSLKGLLSSPKVVFLDSPPWSLKGLLLVSKESLKVIPRSPFNLPKISSGVSRVSAYLPRLLPGLRSP